MSRAQIAQAQLTRCRVAHAGHAETEPASQLAESRAAHTGPAQIDRCHARAICEVACLQPVLLPASQLS